MHREEVSDIGKLIMEPLILIVREAISQIHPHVGLSLDVSAGVAVIQFSSFSIQLVAWRT